MSQDQFVQVAVEAPLFETLTYKVPIELEGKILRGTLVEAPLGRRKTLGVVLGPAIPPEGMTIKQISSAIDEYTLLPDLYLKWLEWLAGYYHHPIGQVMSLAFPPLKKHSNRKTRKSPVIKEVEATAPPQLTEEQQHCIAGISKYSGFATHLLHGVTGSGKTEVYLQLLTQVLSTGKKGIVLVPEISLTPQLVDRFVRRFGEKVAVLHSQLTDRERTNQWWEMIDGKKSILVGARSALFCPVENLGMIIVDEEHEASFKQDEKLKYNGRDAAVMLAKFSNCQVVLGSATPSLETWKNAKEGKYHLHQMKKRVGDRSLPVVEVVDMRLQKDWEREHDIALKFPDKPSWLSFKLFNAIRETLENKKQVALFLNRRGIAPVVFCESCGHTKDCPNCDISLTLHAHTHLVCHYCDYQETFRTTCPDCKEGILTPMGLGTEQVEADIKRLFPTARVARADRDEISNRDDLEELIKNMETGEIDVLVGTQMITKGLDFPNLITVGLVLADIGFNLPDFRATERSFQIITQVSGRAGRHIAEGELPGRVFVQTFNSEHMCLQYAVNNDYEGFAEQELHMREALAYPPYGRLCSIKIACPDLGAAQSASRLLARAGHQLKQQNAAYGAIEILGPAEAPLAKLRGNFRFHLLIKGANNSVVNAFYKQLLNITDQLPGNVKISVDVDPINLL